MKFIGDLRNYSPMKKYVSHKKLTVAITDRDYLKPRLDPTKLVELEKNIAARGKGLDDDFYLMGKDEFGMAMVNEFDAKMVEMRKKGFSPGKHIHRPLHHFGEHSRVKVTVEEHKGGGMGEEQRGGERDEKEREQEREQERKAEKEVEREAAREAARQAEREEERKGELKVKLEADRTRDILLNHGDGGGRENPHQEHHRKKEDDDGRHDSSEVLSHLSCLRSTAANVRSSLAGREGGAGPPRKENAGGGVGSKVVRRQSQRENEGEAAAGGEGGGGGGGGGTEGDLFAQQLQALVAIVDLGKGEEEE